MTSEVMEPETSGGDEPSKEVAVDHAAGSAREIEVGDAVLDVRITGSGPPVVLVHGALVGSQLWDAVVAGLADRFTVVAPELPLGSHRRPLPPEADRTPRGQADRLARLVDRLGLGPVTLVGNDSGGAIAQLVAAHHPERVSRLVLTNCDALDVFPPPAYAYLPWLSRAPRAMAAVVRLLNAIPWLARLPGAYGGLASAPLDGALLRSWLRPSLDPAIRADAAGFFRSASPAITLDAADRLRSFPGRIQLVWGRRDPHFSWSLAERLAAYLPGATLQGVDARCYVPLDRPEAIVEAIAEEIPSRSEARSA